MKFKRLNEEFDIYDFCDRMAKTFRADESYVNDDRYVILKKSENTPRLNYEKIAIGPIEPPVSDWRNIISIDFRSVTFDKDFKKYALKDMEIFTDDVAKVAEMTFRKIA